MQFGSDTPGMEKLATTLLTQSPWQSVRPGTRNARWAWLLERWRAFFSQGNVVRVGEPFLKV